MRRARRIALSALLFLAATSAAVGVAELAFRVYERHFLVEEIALGSDDFDLTALKFNDHEGFLSARAQPDEFRVLSFGDSFAGAITTAPYTYAAVIQRTLDAADRQRRVRVVNLGRGGTTFPDYLNEYRFWSSHVDHHAVLVNIYVGNDFDGTPPGVLAFATGKPYERGAESRTIRVGPGVDVPHVYPLRLIDHALAQYLTWRYAAGPTQARYRPNLGVANEPAYALAQTRTALMYRPTRLARYGDGLRALHRLLEELSADAQTDGRVLISVAPPHFIVSEYWMQRVLDTEPSDSDPIDPALAGSVVAEFVRRSGFRAEAVDLAPCLRAAEERGETVYYETNSHWNVRGNEIVGQLLAEHMASRWLPGTEHAWSDRPPGCSLDPAPASERVAEFVGDTLSSARSLEALEASAVAPLVNRSFGSARELRSALEEIGLRHDPERLSGVLLGVRRQGWDKTARALGWVRDGSQPRLPPLLLFFQRGKLDSARIAGPIDERNRRVFSSRVGRGFRIRNWQRLTWLFVVTRDGRFAQLAVGEASRPSATDRRAANGAKSVTEPAPSRTAAP